MVVMHSVYRESGTVTVDHDVCTRCRQCILVCPADALHLVDNHIRNNTDSPFGCIACGHCVMACPHACISVSGRGMEHAQIIDTPPEHHRSDADSLEALMLARRSVRHFADQPVAREQLERIVDIARTAPMGIPPWDIGCVVLCGRDQVQAVAEQVICGYERMLKVLRPWVVRLMRVFSGKASYEMFRYFIRPLGEMIVREYRDGRDVLFWDAPAAVVFHHSPYTDQADVAIACTYAMLAAESLGLGATVIGSAGPIIQRDKQLQESLGIPAGHKAAHVLIVGHPAVTFHRSIRRSFVNVVYKESSSDTTHSPRQHNP